jgi:hypothetical protein
MAGDEFPADVRASVLWEGSVARLRAEMAVAHLTARGSSAALEGRAVRALVCAHSRLEEALDCRSAAG